VYKGSLGYAIYPIRPGHEALGVIIEAGNKTSLKIGSKAVIFPNTFCGQCEFCQRGQTNVCRGKQVFGINAAGVFGGEFVTDAQFVIPVPDDMPDERAILVEPLAVTVHALKKANITKGTSVAIVGCGTEGLLAVALANHLGANVTVMDVNPLKLNMAKKLGNIRAVHPHEVTGEWFDVVVEAAGVRQSVEQAIQLVKPGGALVAIGITADPVNFPVIHIVRNEITIFGTIIYTLNDFAAALELLSDSSFSIEPVLSKIVPVTEFQQAYEDALSGNFAKIILSFKET
jgi:L-iditol 2-dehydrogenase